MGTQNLVSIQLEELLYFFNFVDKVYWNTNIDVDFGQTILCSKINHTENPHGTSLEWGLQKIVVKKTNTKSRIRNAWEFWKRFRASKFK